MYDDLEPLAELKITKAIEEFTGAAERRLGETRNQMAARGSLLSGNAEQAEFDIQAGTLENVGRRIADTWIDLLSKRNQKLTRDDLTFIMQKVERYALLQARNLGSAMSNRPGGSIVAVGQRRNFWEEQADTRMRKVAGDIRRDLEIRFREQEAFRETRDAATVGSEPVPPNTENVKRSKPEVAAMGDKLDNDSPPSWEKIAIFAFGVVFLAIMLAIAIRIPSPTDFQVFVFRVVLSLVAAAIAALVPGFLHIQSKIYRNTIRASGAIAVFVVVYLINPPKFVISPKTTLPEVHNGSAKTSGDCSPVVAGNGNSVEVSCDPSNAGTKKPTSK